MFCLNPSPSLFKPLSLSRPFLFIGHEDDDYRLMMNGESIHSIELNSPGLYPSTCVQLTLDGLAVTAVLQANHVNDFEGGSGSSISFDYTPQVYLTSL